MRAAAGLLVGLTVLAGAAPAFAGPWTQPKGKEQVILKNEDMRADRGFDPDGAPVDLPTERRDRALGLFAEYGLTDRFTVQLKGDWQSGEDAFVDYEGRGPVEIGVTWQAYRDDRTAVSLYGGYADGGEGRNAGYAQPGVGDEDGEVRASVGRSFGASDRRWGPGGSFVELEAARRMRHGLPDETRIDATAGARFDQHWMCWDRRSPARPTTAAHAGCRSRSRSSAIWAIGACRPDGDRLSQAVKRQKPAALWSRCGGASDPSDAAR